MFLDDKPVVEWPQVADKVVTAIADGIGKAGGMAERIWPEVVRVYWAENLAMVLIWAVVMVVTAWGLRKSLPRLLAMDPGKHSEFEFLTSVVPALTCAAVLLIVGMGGIIAEGPKRLAAVFAPEGSLVKSLVEKALTK